MTTKKEAVSMDSEGRVPEYLVERLAAGDLPPARADEVRRRLSQEPGDGAHRRPRRFQPPDSGGPPSRSRRRRGPPTRRLGSHRHSGCRD